MSRANVAFRCPGSFANEVCRIYKPKYMDDTAKNAEKDKDKDKSYVDASLSSISKDAGKDKEAPKSRSRARSIWGRKK